MREILFKAKRIDNGEWVEGDLVHSVYKINDICVGKYGSEIGIHQVNSDTICQYTGLTDKNGNKIWENDIIVEDWGYSNGVVRFGEFDSQVLKNTGFNIEWKKAISYRQDLPYWAEKIEVIGNIFDNP